MLYQVVLYLQLATVAAHEVEFILAKGILKVKLSCDGLVVLKILDTIEKITL